MSESYLNECQSGKASDTVNLTYRRQLQTTVLFFLAFIYCDIDAIFFTRKFLLRPLLFNVHFVNKWTRCHVLLPS